MKFKDGSECDWIDEFEPDDSCKDCKMLEVCKKASRGEQGDTNGSH